jgi:hypothetical protein
VHLETGSVHVLQVSAVEKAPKHINFELAPFWWLHLIRNKIHDKVGIEGFALSAPLVPLLLHLGASFRRLYPAAALQRGPRHGAKPSSANF